MKNMKKLTLLLLGVIVSNPVFAHYKKPFTGFYGSLNLGLIENKVHDDYETILQWPNAFHITLTSDSKITNSSATGGLALGYSALMNAGWVLGLEGRANFQSFATHNRENITEVNSMLLIQKDACVKFKQDFALIGKLGFASFCKCLMYGLVGVDWAKVDLSLDASYRQNLEALIEGSLEDRSSKYEDGLLLGLGIEYYFTKCATIGLEYNYVDYGSLKFKNPLSGELIVNGTTVEGSFITDHNSLKMQVNKILLKFNYYFA